MSPTRTVEIRFFGSTKQLEAALEKAGLEVDGLSKEIGDKFQGAAQKTGNIFSRLGSKLSGWGLPFGESISKMGEKVGEAETKGKKFGAAMSEVGKALTIGLGAAAIGVGVEAIKMGTEFQETTAQIANHANISTKAAEAIGRAFLGTAGKIEYSGQAIASAYAPVAGELGQVEGHALNAAQALQVMRAASDLAEAGQEPLATTTKSLADSMLVFGIHSSGAAAAANILWNTERDLGVKSSDLVSVYERLRPYIAGAGMSFAQMNGLLLELSHSLGGGRQAARLAGRAIEQMIVPSSKANEALGAMGISLFNAQGKFVGMDQAISLIRSGLARLPASTGAVAAEQRILALNTEMATLKGQQQTKAVKAQEAAINQQLAPLKAQAAAFTKSSAMQAIFGTSANAMLAVISGGASTLNNFTAKVSEAGVLQKAAARQSHTLSVEMKTAKSAVVDLGTELGVILVPAVQKVASVLATAGSALLRNKALLDTVEIAAGALGIFLVGKFVFDVVKSFTQAGAAAVKGVARIVSALAEWMAAQAKDVAESLALWAMYAGQWIARQASAVASFIASNAAAMASWIASQASAIASSLADWAGYFASWVAENAAAVGAFLAENAAKVAAFVAGNATMIASATAAFIAENAASLGIIAGITALVGAIVYLATHWQQAWDEIKRVAADVWHFLYSDVLRPIWQFIGPTLTEQLRTFQGIWTTTWQTVRDVISDVWHVLDRIFTSIESAIDSVIGKIQSVQHAISDVTSALGSVGHDISSVGGGVLGGIGHVLGFAAEGGVVTKPTLLVTGEAGPEAIVPLSKYHLGAPAIEPLSTLSSYTGGRSSGRTIVLQPVYEVQVTGLPQQIVSMVQAALDAHDEELVTLMRAHGA